MGLHTCFHGNKWTVTRIFLAGILVTLCVELYGLFVTKRVEFSVTKTYARIHSVTSNNTANLTDLSSARDYKIKPIKVNVTNCHAIFNGRLTEAAKAKSLTDRHFPGYSPMPNRFLANRSSDCKQYVKNSGYITDPLTENEATFPIAFGIVMYKDAAQVEQLLRAIYRPQNVYCIQLDLKSAKNVKQAVESVAKCFPNVFISNESINIEWGKLSVVKADIACMRLLLQQSKTWKYFINLTGQEFPLKTNSELVDILRAFDGASLVLGWHEGKWNKRYRKAGTPPHGFNPVTGTTHVVLGRPFVEFVVHDRRAHDYLIWTGRVHIPDETYIQTFYHTPKLKIPGAYNGTVGIRKYPKVEFVVHDRRAHDYLNWAGKVHIPDETYIQTFYHTPKLKIPGAYNGTDLKSRKDSSIIRFKSFRSKKYKQFCRGRISHRVCILGMDYLRDMANSRALFANKFHWDYEPAALRCMEELLYNRTRDAYLGKTTFNATAYSKLDFVRNQIHV